MKGAFSVGFIFFCSLWVYGSFLQCYECPEKSTTYDECQSKMELVNCTGSANKSCFNAIVHLEKGSDKRIGYEKGCLKTRDCDRYSKGEIGDCISALNAGYTGYCKGLCCDGDKCNDGDLFATPEPKSKAAAFFLSVVALLFGVLLTVVNMN